MNVLSDWVKLLDLILRRVDINLFAHGPPCYAVWLQENVLFYSVRESSVTLFKTIVSFQRLNVRPT
ncbi:hypothetical protein Plhal304r1_c002g0008901 [Plasmopara halstedii]